MRRTFPGFENGREVRKGKKMDSHLEPLEGKAALEHLNEPGETHFELLASRTLG